MDLDGIYLRAVGFAIGLCDAGAAVFAAHRDAGDDQRGARFCKENKQRGEKIRNMKNLYII